MGLVGREGISFLAFPQLERMRIQNTILHDLCDNARAYYSTAELISQAEVVSRPTLLHGAEAKTGDLQASAAKSSIVHIYELAIPFADDFENICEEV